MSRSYRKSPVYRDSSKNRHSGKYGKYCAARAVRRAGDVPSYGGFRKYYESWDICDVRIYDDSFERLIPIPKKFRSKSFREHEKAVRRYRRILNRSRTARNEIKEVL